MIRHVFKPACLAAALLLGGASTAQNGGGPELGKQTYQTFCIVCHGAAGEGSPVGLSLISPDAKGKSDSELLDIVTKGVPGTAMSAYGSGLTEDEIFSTVHYIRELQRARDAATPARSFDVATMSPEAKAGETLFNGEAGCIQCHSYRGQGGTLGPDLTTIAARLTPEEILAAVLHPSAHINPEFQAKEIQLNDGTRVQGRYRNETSEQIEICNEDGSHWLTYHKEDISRIRDGQTSLMPDDFATRLTREQQEQLLAFLDTLK